MLDRAALSIEAGGKPEDQLAVVSAMFSGLAD
jgi:hypothetical protein